MVVKWKSFRISSLTTFGASVFYAFEFIDVSFFFLYDEAVIYIACFDHCENRFPVVSLDPKYWGDKHGLGSFKKRGKALIKDIAVFLRVEFHGKTLL